jgi:hypothetical protein
MKIILLVSILLLSIEGRSQGGYISIPAPVQNIIVEYLHQQDINDYESYFSSSKEEGRIFEWKIPLEAGMTKEISVYSPEKIVRDDNLGGKVTVIYKQKENEINLLLWVKDINGDVFGALLEKVPTRQKNKIIRKADLSAFEKKFKKI